MVHFETPNETNPYVTGYAYAGNDETESDSWITKIVDAPRGADDDSKRLVYIDDDIAETVDTKTASKLNTKYGNHCADYCATSNQLFEGKFNYEKFGERLAANDKDIEFVEGMIVSKNENDDYINVNLWMMDVDKALGLDVCTSDNDEYVTISVNWYPKAAEHPNKREIDIFVIYAETYGDDFDMELEMNDAEYATVLADFKKKFKDTFGKSLEDIWNEESEEE